MNPVDFLLLQKMKIHISLNPFFLFDAFVGEVLCAKAISTGRNREEIF